MNQQASTVLICVNTDCKSRGAQAVMEALQARLEQLGSPVRVKPYLCFSACNSGPNVVAPDKRCWLSGVQLSDVEDIASFLNGGPAVDRLEGRNDPDLEEMIFEIIDAGLMPDGE